MNEKRVVVTGMGVVSALGSGLDGLWKAIREERSGFRPLSVLDSPRCGDTVVGEVTDDPTEHSGLEAGSRSDHLAVWAAREAVADANLDALEDESRMNIGVVIGGCTGGMHETERYYRQLLRQGRMDFDLMRFDECSGPTRAIANTFGFYGVQTTVSTACSSGALAIAMAREYINEGEADVVVCGGVDSLTLLTLNGFSSLLIHDGTGCKPFDAHRRGMTLGEGAGMLVVEDFEHAVNRGARIYAEIAGAGHSCDAHHVTAPAPDGSGIRAAMARAVEDARLTPADIQYVNAHGTGTRENDDAEIKAVYALRGDNPVPLSSTKGYFGHTLGASGAIEAIVTILALQHQEAPRNLGMDTVDPVFPFSPLERTTPLGLKAALSNSVGFGGNNCSLVLTTAGNGRS